MTTCPPSERGQGRVVGVPNISLERMKLDISNLLHILISNEYSHMHVKIPQYSGVLMVTSPLKILGNEC